MKKNYELALIVSPELTSQEIEKKLEKLRKEISKVGKITNEDIWGMRDLAYRIKLQDKGFYGIFYVEGEAGCLSEVENELRIDSEILRFMVISREEDYVPVVKLEEEGKPIKKEEVKKQVETAARAKKVVKVEEKEEKEEVKEEIKEPEEKEEIKEPEIKEEAKKEDSMKKKAVPKKKSSLDDLDAALDELLKD